MAARLAREAAVRLAALACLVAAMLALLAVQACVVIAGRADRRIQIFRGLSRALNGATDGDGDVTFSAQSWENRLRDATAVARFRVAAVDALPGNGEGHCLRAWEWHEARGLFKPDDGIG